jgi:hypothetical protein
MYLCLFPIVAKAFLADSGNLATQPKSIVHLLSTQLCFLQVSSFIRRCNAVEVIQRHLLTC